MPRYSFMWYEENTVHVSFEAANISSATEYFEDLQNGKFEIDDLPEIKGKWKNGQVEYSDLQEVEIEYDPDAEYKRQLEESIPE
jgi:6-phosphogluconate dehydrogenase (decarboxylating)